MTIAGQSRVLRFALAGAAATGIHVAIAACLIMLASSPPALANAIAACWASIFSYLATTLWTFGAEPSLRSGFRFIIAAGLSAGLAAGVSAVADMRGVHPLIGIFAVVCTVPAFTYILHTRFTYRS